MEKGITLKSLIVVGIAMIFTLFTVMAIASVPLITEVAESVSIVQLDEASVTLLFQIPENMDMDLFDGQKAHLYGTNTKGHGESHYTAPTIGRSMAEYRHGIGANYHFLR